ncbi:MAG: hypothetical protein IKN54_07855, partial [Lachnospiraceae bacterium]|nr:hypothetical protein [Lachnospiraceae bacterium]
AAQFAPFAAVVGHEEAIEETARITDNKIIVDEELILRASDRLRYILENKIEEDVSVTYFEADKLKSGGEYVTITGQIKKYDQIMQSIVMKNGTIIKADNILEISGEIFEK